MHVRKVWKGEGAVVASVQFYRFALGLSNLDNSSELILKTKIVEMYISCNYTKIILGIDFMGLVAFEQHFRI